MLNRPTFMLRGADDGTAGEGEAGMEKDGSGVVAVAEFIPPNETGRTGVGAGE